MAKGYIGAPWPDPARTPGMGPSLSDFGKWQGMVDIVGHSWTLTFDGAAVASELGVDP